MNVKIRKLSADAIIPRYATSGAAGFDLVAAEDVLIRPGETVAVSTGLAVELPDGYELQVRPRSGISLKTKLRVANPPGTIDTDFRAAVGVILDNIATAGHYVSWAQTLDGRAVDTDPVPRGTYLVRRGDRIAQGIVAPFVRAEFAEVTELTETERGSGGFGSTGVAEVSS